MTKSSPNWKHEWIKQICQISSVISVRVIGLLDIRVELLEFLAICAVDLLRHSPIRCFSNRSLQ